MDYLFSIGLFILSCLFAYLLALYMSKRKLSIILTSKPFRYNRGLPIEHYKSLLKIRLIGKPPITDKEIIRFKINFCENKYPIKAIVLKKTDKECRDPIEIVDNKKLIFHFPFLEKNYPFIAEIHHSFSEVLYDIKILNCKIRIKTILKRGFESVLRASMYRDVGYMLPYIKVRRSALNIKENLSKTKRHLIDTLKNIIKGEFLTTAGKLGLALDFLLMIIVIASDKTGIPFIKIAEMIYKSGEVNIVEHGIWMKILVAIVISCSFASTIIYNNVLKKEMRRIHDEYEADK